MKADLVNLNPDIPLPEALYEAFGPRWSEKIYWRLLDNLRGVPHPDPAGHGMKGVIYNLRGDQVLKLTSDESELEAMYRIRGNPSKHLVRVDDVFAICGPRWRRHAFQSLGAVVREFVGNQSMEDEPGLEQAASMLRGAVDQFGEQKIDSARTDLEASRISMEMMIEDLRAMGSEVSIFDGIASGMQHLFNLGVYGIDFNPRNIAIAPDGTPVIFDVGAVAFEKESRIRTVGCSKEATLRVPR